MKSINKLLMAAVAVLCLFFSADAQKTISTDQRSTYLGPKALTFRGFDNNLNGTGEDYLILTNTVYINYGTKFSLTNANFTIRNSGNVWLPRNGSELASVEFEYLGLDPIAVGSNLCIFIGPEGIVDVIDIFLDGHSFPGMFGITSTSSASINISSTEANTIYITQGSWNEPQSGEFTLGGNVVDGLGVGLSNSEWQAAGMPMELDPHDEGGSGGGGLGTGGNGPGDYWGVLQCDGMIYICDYLSLQPYVDNWFMSQTGDIGDSDIDTSELCEELCDLLCSDCDFEVQIELDIMNCVAIAGDVACDPPFNYEWQKKINGVWISIVIGTTEDGSIPDLMNIYKNKEYRLLVRCSDYCIKESNVVSYYRCPEEPCSVDIQDYQNYCYMGVVVTGCPTAHFQWFEFIGGVYIEIPNELQSSYKADHGGDFRVVIHGCPDCTQLFWDFHIEPTNIKTFVETVDLCSYMVCMYPKADSILNITVFTPNTINLNSEPDFSFNYSTSNSGLSLLVDDINKWLDANGYYGTATTLTLNNFCQNEKTLIIANTNIIFDDITFSFPNNNGGDSQTITQDWVEFDCHPEDIGFQLLAIPDCEDFVSIIWSTGETGESISVSDAGTYSATVDCGDGCIMTESITIDNNNQTLTKKAENDLISIIPSKQNLEEIENPVSGIKVYPNPGRGLYTVEIDAGHLEKISLSLYSTTGTLVKTLPPIEVQNGTVKTSLDIQNLQAGIYILKANELSSNNVSKVILIK